MLSVAQLDFIPVNVPYTRPEISSQVNRAGVTDVLVRAVTSDGIVGWGESCSATFIIAQAPGGAGLGTIELHFFEADPGLAEVGYWLRQEARGHGAATIAVRLVASWAFDKLGIQRLNLTTAPGNEASQQVARRAGFIREGLLRAWVPIAGSRRDSKMFSRLSDDPR